MKSGMGTLISSLICGAGLVAMTGGAIAQGNDQVTIEGTWLSKVTASNPPPGVPPVFLSLSSHTRSGEVSEANTTSADRSVGLGEWTRTGNRQFERTLTFFNYAPGHVFVTFTKVNSSIELAPDGESYTANNSFRIYDATGLLVFSGQNTTVAKRCGLGDDIPICIPQ